MTTPIVVPQSPMGLGDVFGTTFSIVKRRFGRLAPIALVQQLVALLLIVPLGIYAAIVLLPQLEAPTLNSADWVSGSGVAMAISGVTQILGGFVSVYFIGLLVHCSHQAMLNQNPDFGELRALNRGTVRRVGPVYALAMLAQFLAVAVGMLPMLGLFPELMSSAATSGTMSKNLAVRFLGVWFLTMLTVLVVSVVGGIVVVKTIYLYQVGTVEGLGWTAAVKRAWALTKGSFWRTAGYLIVMSIAVGVVQEVVVMAAEGVLVATSPSFFSSDPRAMFSNGFLWLFYGVVYGLMMIAQVVCVPFQVAFITVMYVDQIRRIQQGPVVRPMPGHYGPPTYYTYPQQPQGWPQQGVPQPPPPWPQQGVPQPPFVPPSPSDDRPPA
jgi:hypothetical protein